MDVCLWWVLCVVRYRSLRQTDDSSRGVLPTMVHHCVWSRNLENEVAKVRYQVVKTSLQWVVMPGKQTKNLWIKCYGSNSLYVVLQFNSQDSRNVLLWCWVRQIHVLKHVWTYSNLCLHEPQTDWVFHSWAAEEVVRVCAIRLAEKWVTRIWSSR